MVDRARGSRFTSGAGGGGCPHPRAKRLRVYVRHHPHADGYDTEVCLQCGHILHLRPANGIEKSWAPRYMGDFELCAWGGGIDLLKSSSTPPGHRWITVHPNGKEEEGYPVLIKENPDGTGHVVGGVGGALNGLHLTRLNSSAQLSERRAERKAELKRKREAMTPDEKSGVDHQKQKLSGVMDEVHDGYIAVARRLGMIDDKPLVSDEEKASLSQDGIDALARKRRQKVARHVKGLFRGMKEKLSKADPALARELRDRLSESVLQETRDVVGSTFGGDAADAIAGIISRDVLSRLSIPEAGDTGQHLPEVIADIAHANGLTDEAVVAQEAVSEQQQMRAAIKHGVVRDEDEWNAKKEAASKRATERAAVNAEIAGLVDKLQVADPQLPENIVEEMRSIGVLDARAKAVGHARRKVNDWDPSRDGPLPNGVAIMYEHMDRNKHKLDADALDKALAEDLQSMRQVAATSGLLGAVEEHGGRKSMGRALADAHYGALSNIAIMATDGQYGVAKDVADKFGVAGAAHALVEWLRANKSPEEFSALRDAIEKSHRDGQVEYQNNAMARIGEEQAAIADLESKYIPVADYDPENATEEDELARIQNQTYAMEIAARATKVREVLSETLGHMEALGALNWAFRQERAPEHIDISLGATTTKGAMEAAYAAGLRDGEFEHVTDGLNHYLRVPGAALAGIYQEPYPDVQKRLQTKRALLRGDFDDTDESGQPVEKWLPAGIREKAAQYTDPDRVMEPPKATPPVDFREDMSDDQIRDALMDQIHGRICDGQNGYFDLRDNLCSHTFVAYNIPESIQDRYQAISQDVFDLGDGTADEWDHRHGESAGEWYQGRFGDNMSPVDKQTIPYGEQGPIAHDVARSILANRPDLVIAHARLEGGIIGLNMDEKIREYFYRGSHGGARLFQVTPVPKSPDGSDNDTLIKALRQARYEPGSEMDVNVRRELYMRLRSRAFKMLEDERAAAGLQLVEPDPPEKLVARLRSRVARRQKAMEAVEKSLGTIDRASREVNDLNETMANYDRVQGMVESSDRSPKAQQILDEAKVHLGLNVTDDELPAAISTAREQARMKLDALNQFLAQPDTQARTRAINKARKRLKADEEKLAEQEGLASWRPIFEDPASDPHHDPTWVPPYEMLGMANGWNDFVNCFDGSNRLRKAQRFVHAVAKGEFNRLFAAEYSRREGRPSDEALRLGSEPIDHFDEGRVGVLPPDERAKALDARRNARQRDHAKARKRVARGLMGAGQWVAGSKGEAAEVADANAAQRAQKAETANIALFGSDEVPGQAQQPAGGGGLFDDDELPPVATPQVSAKTSPARYRATLGKGVESALRSIFRMGLARDIASGGGAEPPKQLTFSGPRINQQRGIRSIAINKRMGINQNVGTGKTIGSIAGFTQAKAAGEARRGLFAVPIPAFGEYIKDKGRVVDDRYQMYGNCRATSEQRRAAYKSGRGDDMVLVTHEGIRDDLLWALAQHRFGGSDPQADGKIREWVKNASVPEIHQAMVAAIAKQGWDHFDYVCMDETHRGLNRRGKDDSLLAKLMHAYTYDKAKVPYFVPTTANIAKNDVSEAYDFLSYVDPETFPPTKEGQDEFVKRYPQGSESAMEAMGRLVSAYSWTAGVSSSHGVEHTSHDLQLSAEQAKAYAQIERSYARAKRAHKDGDHKRLADAMEAMAPEYFSSRGVTDDQGKLDRSQRLAHSNIQGTYEAALSHVVNGFDMEHNVKAHHLLHILETNRDHKGNVSPTVVFVHNIEAAKAVRDHLESKGIKVAHIDGSMNAEKRGIEKGKFQPVGRWDPEADVLVCTDAMSVGANLQRTRDLVHWDTQWTPYLHEQRTGRGDRSDRVGDLRVHQLRTHTPHELRRSLVVSGKGAPVGAVRNTHLLDDTEDAQRILSARERFIDAAERIGSGEFVDSKAQEEYAAGG